jgi:hypothetical protein
MVYYSYHELPMCCDRAIAVPERMLYVKDLENQWIHTPAAQ